MGSSDPHSILFNPKNHDPLLGHHVKGKKATTTRYFAGQAPSWLKEEEEEQQRILIKDDLNARKLQRLRAHATPGEGRKRRGAVVVEEAKDSPRKKEAEIVTRRGEAEVVKRGEAEDVKRGDAEVVKRGGDVKEEVDDVQDRRERAKMLAKLREEEDAQVVREDGIEEEDLSFSESEEDDDELSESEDEFEERVLAKPVFVHKGHRETDKEKAKIRKEEQALAEAKAKQRGEHAAESKKQLFDVVRAEEQEKEEEVSEDEAVVDDTDPANEQEAYEEWRLRELTRWQQELAAREKRAAEQREVERRRLMTDEERALDDARLDKEFKGHRKKSEKFGFLQKYFHRGAYFQDKAVDGSEPLYLRDFHEPTAADMVDREAMPKVMQVRRGQWGFKGNVKHTHLTAEDTTNKDSLWGQADKAVTERLDKRRGGSKLADQVERPGRR